MAAISLKVDKLPPNISEKRLRELLSAKGKVVSLKLTGASASIQMESDVIFNMLMRSSTKTMGIISLVSMDSGALGEWKFTTVTLL